MVVARSAGFRFVLFLVSWLLAAGCGGSKQSEPMVSGIEARDSSPGGPPPPSEPHGAPQPTSDSADKSSAFQGNEPAPKAPADRPGLATHWGEARESKITTTAFQRADASAPFTTGVLHYNDEEGARSMANTAGFRRFGGGAVAIWRDLVHVGLRDERGSFLAGFDAGERKFIVGEAGARYSIVIQNNAPARIEVVVSVDGLDVLDGKAASFKNRGYVVDANRELVIEGFRTSVDAVAAFRFGSVRGSYAEQKHGDTRNVGVIGVAVFHERGANPASWSRDTEVRNNANPFPGQFATPP